MPRWTGTAPSEFIKAVHNKLVHCEKCTLKDQPAVPGCGPIPCEVMFVAEAPGRFEVIEGVPLIGPSGEVLRRTLSVLGIDPSKVYYSNACLCRPPENRTPELDEIKACNDRLIAEVRRVKPKVIVALGTTSLRALVKVQGSITEVRGQALWSETLKAYVLPTFHPAYVLRQTRNYSLFERDLEKIKTLVNLSSSVQVKPIETETIVAKSVLDALKAINFLQKQPALSCDVETSGFDFLENRILSIGFSWQEGRALVIPGKFLNDPLVKLNLKTLFLRNGITWIYHNGKFDVKFLRTYLGFFPPINYDTILASSVLDSNGPHDLKFLAREFFGAPDWEAALQKYLPKKSASYELVPEEVLYKYAGYDVDYTFRLWKRFESTITHPLQRKLLFEMLIPAQNFLAEVEYNGVTLDVNRQAELEKLYSEKISKIEERLKELAGEDFNPRSPKQVAELLYKKLDLPDYSGEGSTREECLQRLSGEHEVVDLLLEHRKLQKLYSTYILAMKEQVDKHGKIHCDFMLFRTATGRLASKDPNLQNIPRQSDVRSLFCASPGCVLLQADMKAAELRVLAYYSNDPLLKQVFIEGRDLHSEVAAHFFGENFTKEDRVRAKMINFGIVYQTTEYGLSNTAGVSVEEAREFIRRWFERFPGAKKWIDQLKQDTLQGKVFMTPFGRKRDFGLITRENVSEVLKQAVNAPIQSLASDLLLHGAMRLHGKLGDKARILVLVHDSVLLDVKEEHLLEVAKLVKETLEDVPLQTDLPFPVELEYGHAWGELQPLEI